MTKIFKARKIHTFTGQNPGGNALVVAQQRVAAVLDIDRARNMYPDADIVDFGSATLTPGLVDSHIHLTEWAVARSQIDLADAHTIEDAAQRAARAPQRDGWIIGRGWNPHQWGGTHPGKEALDALVPDVPVVLQSHDMHSLWLNSRALEIAGIAGSSGVLHEEDAQVMVPHLPRYDARGILPLVLDAQSELHSYGITAVHSLPGVHLQEPNPLAVFQLMRETGQLRLRVLQHLALAQLDHAIALGLRSGFGDDWIRIGGVKMFLDGALGSRTAWMRTPYENSSECGIQVMHENDFRDAVTRAAANGIATVVHAIGDAAVTLAFTVLSEAANVPGMPHRVEHVQCLPRELDAFLEKGIVCSVQPSHLMTDWSAADRHWGKRGADTYAFRFMRDRGARLVFGSDAPVEKADPRHALFAAVRRQTPEQQPAGGWYVQECLTPREAFEAHTIEPAKLAGFNATGLGSGALADFVAWRQDPLALDDAMQLLNLEVAATVVAGDIVLEN